MMRAFAPSLVAVHVLNPILDSHTRTHSHSLPLTHAHTQTHTNTVRGEHEFFAFLYRERVCIFLLIFSLKNNFFFRKLFSWPSTGNRRVNFLSQTKYRTPLVWLTQLAGTTIAKIRFKIYEFDRKLREIGDRDMSNQIVHYNYTKRITMLILFYIYIYFCLDKPLYTSTSSYALATTPHQ